MLNRAQLIGRIGKDVEVRQAGKEPVAALSIATTEKWKDRNGEDHERTDWHRAVLWGKRAESLKPYLTKGKLIFVEGRLQTREYEKNGAKHQITEIRIDELKLLGDRSSSSRGEETRTSARTRTPEPARSEESNFL